MRNKETQLLHTLPLCVLLIVSVFSPIPASVSSNFSQEERRGLTESVMQTALSGGKHQPFTPTPWKPLWVDQNNNNVADRLDHEISNRLLNATAGNYVNVIVALRSQPTADDANAFALSGGYLTTAPWTNALYGFGGQIPYNRIADFVQSNPNVLLVEKSWVARATVAYAAQQVGARTYVWNTLGLRGDSNSSIAIVDSGIDASHLDFSSGFGDKNFTHKIVGWNDQIDPATTAPYDDGGHGTHVAGLAAGNGFFSTDALGNAEATWGANLGRLSGAYYVTGLMVNKDGLITLNVKWKNAGKGTLETLYLYSGNKTLNPGSWSQVASVNPINEDEWYTLTFNVSSIAPGDYDLYHVQMDFAAGFPPFRDNFSVVFTMSWPFSPPADDFPAWTGIAPEAKLVGVKVLDYTGSGTDAGLLSAIDWIIANRAAYHIVLTSMSLGFAQEVSTVDTALANLVTSGITTIVSAGNNASGGNYIYTPGSVDEVLTVAATNQFDNIADYSSQGGTSRYTGNTVKPDLTAPGGSFFAVPLLSADSNDGDADLGWSEVTLNDGAPMQGTSMSTPVVAGAANILIEAMGGFANWQYTRSQALLPKMILLMTATETYPNLREYFVSDSPTLERGGKDVHEGYGRLNLDAAVDAVLKTYPIGTNVTDTLGRPPSLSDISVVGQKLAWARKVQLGPHGRYNFTLAVPEGADFDLYLYNSTGTLYGEPVTVAQSTNATLGGYEQIILTPLSPGTYYLVVKRATAATEGGTFFLESTLTPNHDITLLEVEPSATSVYEGDELNITVTVKNRGLNTESFNVTTFYNNDVIETLAVLNLTANDSTTLKFVWNTSETAPSYYTIEAQADLLLNEYNTTDNVFVYKGIVHVKILGDVNSDDQVDVQDLTELGEAFGTASPSTNWSLECDLNRDELIDVSDLATLGKNYGKTV